MVRRGFTGLDDWGVQRASALYMLAFMFAAVGSLAVHPRSTFAEWAGWVHSPIVSIASLLFVLALCSHMWVGLRDVLLDYAKPASLRRGLLVLLAVLLVSLAVWASIVLLVPAT
jgi:succinate dehydrogenase / fumarate reductase membrane anchor subunit